ncbi:MAG: DNA repair protein RecO [Acidobacteria bacterium]|nr:DNA repair protein RecO [Acidobacteriota bacterium]MCI0721575.1 DNA repair protein RecO [Acidobacteriota bacterium]
MIAGLCCSEAVVLRSYPLRESDLITVLYTRSFGRINGVARGAQRSKSRFAGKLEPLSLAEVVFFARKSSDLVSIDSVDLIESFAQRTHDYRGLMQLSFLAELLADTTPEREPSDAVFRLLLLVLPHLTQPATADLAQLYFEVWYLKLAGLYPSHRHCHRCHGSLANSTDVFVGANLSLFVCQECQGSGAYRISAAALEMLDAIGRLHLSEICRRVSAVAVIAELRQIAEALLQRSFERSFHSLKLIHQEV